MRDHTDLAAEAIQAGVFLGREGLFMNSPDVAQVVMGSNTQASGFVTVSQVTENTRILGLTIGNFTEKFFYITDLGNRKYRLIAPILVSVREEGGEWIATFADAELSRSGETQAEAIDWLKSSVIDLYEFFRGEKHLGPLPQRQFQVLSGYLGQKPHRAR
ncbi:MAG: hypothetical protein K8F62_06635 [Pseudorhodoplanes sp.]|nr:hypothetical protein [Pseudorhodoplanes sp.]